MLAELAELPAGCLPAAQRGPDAGLRCSPAQLLVAALMGRMVLSPAKTLRLCDSKSFSLDSRLNSGCI